MVRMPRVVVSGYPLSCAFLALHAMITYIYKPTSQIHLNLPAYLLYSNRKVKH